MTRGIALLFVVVAGTVWRLHGLEERSLWFDEAFSWQLTRFDLWELLERAADDVHPPLYYLLLRAWTSWFGESVFSLRLMSVLLAAASMVAMYYFVIEACRVAGPRSSPIDITDQRGHWVGLATVGLIALSPLQLRYSCEVRMYTLGAVLTAWSSFYLFKALRAGSNGKRLWAMYGLLAAGLAYTHSYGLFTIIAQAVFLLAWLVVCAGLNPIAWRHHPVFRGGLVAAAICLVLYSPWIPVLIHQTRQVQQDYWIGPLTWNSIPWTSHQLLAYSDYRTGGNLGGWLAAGFLLLVLAVLLYRPGPAEWFVFLSAVVPVLLPIVLSFALGRTIFLVRYLYFAHLFVLCAVAVVVARIPDVAIRGLVTTMVVANSAATMALMRVEFDIPIRPGARGAAAWIEQNGSRDEPVIVSSSRIYFPLKYHLQGHGSLFLFHFPDQLQKYGGSQIITPGELVDESFLRAIEAHYVWIVHMTGFSAKEIPIPSDWKLEESQTLYDAYPWVGAIYVRHYRTAEQSAAQDIERLIVPSNPDPERLDQQPVEDAGRLGDHHAERILLDHSGI